MRTFVPLMVIFYISTAVPKLIAGDKSNFSLLWNYVPKEKGIQYELFAAKRDFSDATAALIKLRDKAEKCNYDSLSADVFREFKVRFWILRKQHIKLLAVERIKVDLFHHGAWLGTEGWEEYAKGEGAKIEKTLSRHEMEVRLLYLTFSVEKTG